MKVEEEHTPAFHEQNRLPFVRHIVVTDKNGKPIRIEHELTIKIGDTTVLLQMP